MDSQLPKNIDNAHSDKHDYKNSTMYNWNLQMKLKKITYSEKSIVLMERLNMAWDKSGLL